MIKKKSIFIYFSGVLPAGLRFGSSGVSWPVNNGSSTTQLTSSDPTNDTNNYASVYAQMLNMMSNQSIVCSWIIFFESFFVFVR